MTERLVKLTNVRTPRWVKLFGIVALLMVVLLVILLATGGHGPGRHMLGR
jgi:hypothetical protein